MSEDDRILFDALMRLAEFRNARIADRRRHEWIVTVGLWGLLGFGIVHHPIVPHLGLLLIAILFVHAFLWVGSHWSASKEDIEIAFYYTDKAHQRALPDAEVPPNDNPQEWPSRCVCEKFFGFLLVPRCWAQILATGLLASAVYLSAN